MGEHQPAWPDEIGRWRAARADPNVVLLDGLHAIKHALRFEAAVISILTTDAEALRRLADEVAPDITPVLAARAAEVPVDAFRDLLPRPHPTAVAALAYRPDPDAVTTALSAPSRPAPVVVLDQPRNLGNVGAVIRLAAGFGAAGVVTTGPLDPWHPQVIRGSAGLHFATAVARYEPDELPPGPIFAFDAGGADIRTVELPDDALLAFGSERSGLSAGLRGRAAAILAIPMRPRVSSFNLATSVSMGLFHWMSHQGGQFGRMIP